MPLDDEKVRQIIIMVEEWKHPVKKVAQHFSVSTSRIYQLLKEYRQTGRVPLIKQRGRKKRIVSAKLRQDIVSINLI